MNTSFDFVTPADRRLTMKNDVDMSVYLEDNERYADLVNVSGKIDGRKIRAEDVKPYETKLFYRIEKKLQRMRFSKQRDTVRRIIFGVNVVITEVELQETIDYSYPLRDMGYTYGEYEQQARRIRKKVRAQKRGLTNGEYLYGFKQQSRLRPTVIFLLYFGVEKWDGPTCIHDMLDFTDVPDEIKRLVQNHYIHLIDVHRMKEEDLKLFRADVGKVFRLIKNSENKNGLKEIVENDPYYSSMDKDAYLVAANYIQADALLDYEKYENEGGYDMCTGLKEWLEDERMEGISQGIIQGKIRLLVDLVNDKVININEAAKRIEVTEEEFLEIMEEELRTRR